VVHHMPLLFLEFPKKKLFQKKKCEFSLASVVVGD